MHCKRQEFPLKMGRCTRPGKKRRRRRGPRSHAAGGIKSRRRGRTKKRKFDCQTPQTYQLEERSTRRLEEDRAALKKFNIHEPLSVHIKGNVRGKNERRFRKRKDRKSELQSPPSIKPFTERKCLIALGQERKERRPAPSPKMTTKWSGKDYNQI